MARIKTTEAMPFPLAKPNADTPVTEAENIGYGNSDISGALSSHFKKHGDNVFLSAFKDTNYISYGSGNWTANSAPNSHYWIPCNAGDVVTLTPNGTLNCIWAFLSGNEKTGTPSYVEDGQTKPHSVSVGNTETWTAPEGTHYLYIAGAYGGGDYTPSVVKFKEVYPTNTDMQSAIQAATSPLNAAVSGLNTSVLGLQTSVNSCIGKTNDIDILIGNPINLVSYKDTNYISFSSGEWTSDDHADAHYLIPCSEGDVITLTANSSLNCVWAFLSGNEKAGSPSYVEDGQTKPHSVSAGNTETWTAPEGTHYLYLNGNVLGNYDYTPSVVKFKRKVVYQEELAHVQSQVNSISDITKEIFPINAFDGEGAQDGYLNINGTKGTNAQTLISDMMQVSEGDVVYFTGSYNTSSLPAINGYSSREISNTAFVQVILGWTEKSYDNQRIVIPSGVSYIAAWGKKDSALSLTKDSLFAHVERLEEKVGVTTVIDFKPSDGGLRALLESITDATATNRYEIRLAAGTYNLGLEINDNELPLNSAQDTKNIFHGVFVPNFVTIVGAGIDATVITLDLDGKSFGEGADDNKSKYVSTLNFAATAAIKGCTISGNYTRYAIHDDFANASNSNIDSAYDRTYERLIENCKIISRNAYYNSAYGCGVKSGARYILKNCIFDSQGQSCYIHTNTSFTVPAEITIENCVMLTSGGPNQGIVLIGKSSGTKDVVHLIGNKTTGYTFRSTDASISYKLDGYGNSLNVPIRIVEETASNWLPDFRDLPTNTFVPTLSDGTGYFVGVTKYDNGQIKVFNGTGWV